MDTIKKIEIESIGAETLLEHFKNFNNRLDTIQNALKPQPATHLLTRQEVAKLLDISLPTLHVWSKNGTLQSYRIGNKVRYKKSEVLGALQSIQSK